MRTGTGKKSANTAIRKRIDTLTQREREVLDWVVSGTSNKRIAAELGISIKTVEVHRARVMEKMAAKSVAELTAMRIICGLH